MTSPPEPRQPDGPGDAAATPADPWEAAETEIARVKEPARLLRVSAVARSLLDEARGLSLDKGASDQLRHIHAQLVEEIAGAVAPELREELERLLPASSDTLSQAEIRIAQSQLVGWLEGVFQGIKVGMSLHQVAPTPPPGPNNPPPGPRTNPYI